MYSISSGLSSYRIDMSENPQPKQIERFWAGVSVLMLFRFQFNRLFFIGMNADKKRHCEAP